MALPVQVQQTEQQPGELKAQKQLGQQTEQKLERPKAQRLQKPCKMERKARKEGICR